MGCRAADQTHIGPYVTLGGSVRCDRTINAIDDETHAMTVMSDTDVLDGMEPTVEINVREVFGLAPNRSIGISKARRYRADGPRVNSEDQAFRQFSGCRCHPLSYLLNANPIRMRHDQGMAVQVVLEKTGYRGCCNLVLRKGFWFR